MKRTGNQFMVSMQVRKLSRHRLWEVSHLVIPNLFRDSVLILSEDGGPLTDNAVFIGIQRILVPMRTVVLRSEMLKQVQHDEFRRFRNKHSLSFHGACPEMPLFRVIPNLFRDLLSFRTVDR